MADIFISYSSQDRAKAVVFCDQLRAAGLSFWIDDSGISAAVQWSAEIVKAIEKCKVFIILLSHSALESHNVVKELTLASEKKKHIVPVDLEPVKLTHQVEYQLAGLQRVGYREHDRIEKAIRSFLGLEQISPAQPEEMHRRLLAIMFTDIEGYSKIMNTDERLAMKILKFHNDFMRTTIERGEGRVVEIIGDAFLATFESAVRAIEVSIAIQQGFQQHNEELPQEERFHIRIGIHLGDIIEEEAGIKGDAVNIAARIQTIAPGGGVAFSETVYDAVKHKMPLDVVSLGRKTLKNIQDPYTIYILKNGISSQDHPSVSPESKSGIRRLAVIPFEDQSPNHDNEWFGDGLTDDLISTLNKLDDVFVLDRQSSKEYRNSRLNTKQIAQELAVRYIITGSVRKHEKDIRVQATLIDTETGKTLWDEKFPGTMDDIFDIQERTAKDIAEGLKLKLTPQEKKEIEKKITENPEAYELYLLAVNHAVRETKQDFQYAIKLYKSAIDLDPTFASSYALMSGAYSTLYRLYERKSEYLELARKAVETALELDPRLSDVFRAFSFLLLAEGSAQEAIQYAKRAIELDPKTQRNYFQLGFIYSQTSNSKEAAACFEESLQLDMNTLSAHLNLCFEYYRMGDKEKLSIAAARALPFFERRLRKYPDDQTTMMHYATILEYSGRIDESLREIEHVVSLANADGLTLYNAACILIRQGRIEQGLHALERAATAGFTNIETFRTDPDLEPLRKMPEFQEILRKLEQ